MNRKLLITIITALLLLVGTYTAIQFAKGYRPDIKTGEIKGTGLLVVNSKPEGAQVFINGKLTTATDDTLHLVPGDYKIEIKKDGYIPWKKDMVIEEELVTQANARLFPAVTSLHPLTFTGASNISPSPDGHRIAYTVTESSETSKKGIWIIDLVQRPLSLSKDPRQIARNSESLDFSECFLTWSPDSSQILAHFPEDISGSETNILLNADEFNSVDQFRDVTARLPVIFSQWEEQLALKLNDQILKLPVEIQNIATSSATNIYFSPDEEKVLYEATQEITIPENLMPPLPGSNNQPEERELKLGSVYVYDIEEDKNFLISKGSEKKELDLKSKIMLIEKITPRTLIAPESSPSAHTKLQAENNIDTLDNFDSQYSPIHIQQAQWFPDSKHLILTQEEKISIIEYDGTNGAVIYAGKFENKFSYPWPDESKLIILTNLNTEASIPPNLYAINLN